MLKVIKKNENNSDTPGMIRRKLEGDKSDHFLAPSLNYMLKVIKKNENNSDTPGMIRRKLEGDKPDHF
jgi:hypothetical protein